jgi:hypothetical protein
MVDLDLKVVRGASLQRKRDALAKAQEPFVKGIRIDPRDDDMRKVLRHPRGGGFRSTGSIEWPNDQFTQRRLRDGTVTLAEDKTKRSRRASTSTE